MPTRYTSLLIPKVLPFLLLIAVISLQYYFDLEKERRLPVPPTIIPARAVKIMDLGQHSAASALMWIYTVQQVGTHPKKIPELIKTVTELDPKFSYPYAFAALILPSFGFPDEATSLAIKGMAETGDWRIPYYLATTYHIFHKDRSNASLYFDKAANTPGIPANLKLQAARYGTSMNLDETKQIWVSIYETSGDEIILERAKNYILHYEMIEALIKAVGIYRQKYGRPPKTLEDLVSNRILKSIPTSPLGVKFGIRPDGSIIVQ